MINILEKTRALIREAKLDAAFHQILQLTANSPQETPFVQLNSQWSEIKSMHLNGHISFEDYFAERNRITMAFLTRIDDIEATTPQDKKPKGLSIEGKMEADIVEKALIDFHDGVLDLPADPDARSIYVHYWALFTKKNVQIGRK